MSKSIALNEGVIRPSLVAKLEAFRAPDRLVSSYYLDLDLRKWGNTEAVLIAAKNALKQHRERIDKLDVRPAVRHALHRDWDVVPELVRLAVGERGTRSLACFVDSESGVAHGLRLPWPIRDRAFFEDRFVLWPLRLILDQADRYAICLTDKDDARLFLFYLEQIEEVADVFDVIPGRVRFPDPLRQGHYMHKHVEHFHRHFEKTAEAALRLLEREPFEHLIIGGLWQTLPEFETHLHSYLRQRLVARWDIDVHTPTPQIRERAMQEEQQFLQRQARDIWQTIQDHKPTRGALGPDEVFAALWQRRIQALLLDPDVQRPGFRCIVCGRLNLDKAPCVECGGSMSDVADVIEEAQHEALEQAAQVRFWKDPALKQVDSIAALKRF